MNTLRMHCRCISHINLYSICCIVDYKEPCCRNDCIIVFNIGMEGELCMY